MTNARHSELRTIDIHPPIRWEFTNAATRANTTDPNTGAPYQASDIGNFARQADNNSIWMLTGTTPDWVGISVASANLTSGRIPYATNDNLADDAGFAYDPATKTATINDKQVTTYGNGGGVTLSNVTLHLPFTAQKLYANLNGHLGQSPNTATGSIVGFDGGKFGNGVVSLTQGFTNYIHYPSLSVDWTPVNITTSVVTNISYVGGQSMKVHKATGDTGYSAYPNRDASVDTLANGDSLTFSAYIYVPSNSIATNIKIRIKDNTTGVSYWSNEITTRDEWTLATITFTNNTGGTVNILYYLNINGTAGDDCYYYLDAAQITKTPYQLPYRDGDMPGCSWTGTPHASTTQVTRTTLKYTNPLASADAGTIMTWFRLVGAYTNYRTLVGSVDTSGNNRLNIYYYSSIGIVARFRDGNGNQTYVTHNTNLQDGEWHHVAVSWDTATGLQLYLDGTLVNSSSTVYVPDTLQPMYIGNYYTTYPSQHINGEMAGTVIVSKPLDETTIRAIYESGVPINIPHANHELNVNTNIGLVTINDAGILVKDDANALIDLTTPGIIKLGISGQPVLINTTTPTTNAQLDVAGDIVVSDGAGGAISKISDDGRVNFGSLPTSSSGLSAGDLWNDGGTLKIV